MTLTRRLYPIPRLPELTPTAMGMKTVVASAYLAGPMRGYPLNNFQAFFEAAVILRRHQWIIENPAEYDMAAGVNPAVGEDEWPITVREMLRTDFQIILDKVDCVILLLGWRKSIGSRLEVAIAHYIGLPVFELTMTDGKLSMAKVDIESAIPQVLEHASIPS